MHTSYVDMEEKILSMYAKGMTTGDIESHMQELYDIDISDSTISQITDKILPNCKRTAGTLSSKSDKSKTIFPSDDSLLKMLYLATIDITKKWTGHCQDWGQLHSQLEICFEDRLAGRNL